MLWDALSVMQRAQCHHGFKTRASWTNIQEILHSTVWIVVASLEGPQYLVPRVSHLLHIGDSRLKSISRQKRGSQSWDGRCWGGRCNFRGWGSDGNSWCGSWRGLRERCSSGEGCRRRSRHIRSGGSGGRGGAGSWLRLLDQLGIPCGDQGLDTFETMSTKKSFSFISHDATVLPSVNIFPT